MKEFIKKIVPGFIRNLDQELLVRHPFWWASKIIYFLYFIIPLFLINLFIVNVIPVGFDHIPDASLYLTYFAITNLIVLLFWLFRQSLFKVFTLHGLKIRRYYIGSVAIFFLVFCISSSAVYFPYNRLINRILIRFNEAKLPGEIRSINMWRSFESFAADSIAASINSMDTTAFSNYRHLDSLSQVYKSLDSADKNNIFICLNGTIKFEDFNGFNLYSKSDHPFIQWYNMDYNENKIWTERIYYRGKSYSLYSQVYEKTVNVNSYYHERLDSLAVRAGDTIRKYTFINARKQLVVCDSALIQESLLEDRISVEFKTYNQVQQFDNNYSQAQQVGDNYRNALNEKRDPIVYQISVVLTVTGAPLVFILYMFFNFFNGRRMALGFVFSVVLFLIMMLIISLNQKLSAKELILPFGILLSLLFLVSFFLNKNGKWSRFLLQIFAYFIWFILSYIILFCLVSKVDDISLDLYFYCCLVFLFVLPVWLLRKTYKIYCQPIG